MHSEQGAMYVSLAMMNFNVCPPEQTNAGVVAPASFTAQMLFGKSSETVQSKGFALEIREQSEALHV